MYLLFSSTESRTDKGALDMLCDAGTQLLQITFFCSLSLTRARQCERLLLQSPLFCCRCPSLFLLWNNGPEQCCHHVGKPDYCKITSVRMCDLSVQSTHSYKNRVVRVQYARTVLMTQFASRALYAVPRVRVKSEVYFGLKTATQGWQSCICSGTE